MSGTGQVFVNGSGIGSDSSIIAANHRYDDHPSKNNLRCFSSKKIAMDDEYGEMTAEGDTYTYPGPFELESGEVLEEATLKYQTYGKLNEDRDNVLVICHALTGNASLHSWWGGLLGPKEAFDTEQYFIICANILGSCYGSTSPQSINPSTNEPYMMSFPDVSVKDSVKLQLHMLRDHLNLSSIKSVIGGSLGGSQVLEFGVQAGKSNSFGSSDDKAPFVRSMIPIACNGYNTAWQIGLNEIQRQAIYADSKWNNGNPSNDDPPLKGLSVARQIGMISYRSQIGYETKFGRTLKDADAAHHGYGSSAKWNVQSYLEYQGTKFLSRFDPVTYIKLTEQLDSHDVGRGRGGVSKALSDVQIPVLVLGVDSDVLYPLNEQEELCSYLSNSELKVIQSDAGHDGFLLEQQQVGKYITDFLN